MTHLDHVRRVKRLAHQAQLKQQIEDARREDVPGGVCRCRTCGAVTQLVRGKLVSQGWSRNDAGRVVATPPHEDCSYPYLASVRVDGVEVYRVHSDLAEATDGDVMADIEAALKRRR